MARSGDGVARSNTRKRQSTICSRVSAEEKRTIKQNADRLDYQSVGAFVRDVAMKPRQTMRQRQKISGQLSHLGATLLSLAQEANRGGEPDFSASLIALSAQTVAIQKALFEEESHDRQSDIE